MIDFIRQNTRRIKLMIISGIMFLIPSLVFAEGKTKDDVTKGGTGFSATTKAAGLSGTADIATIAGGLIRGLLGLVGVIFLLLMVYAGFLWTTAGGNQDRVDKAKKIIVAAVIGAVLVFSAYTITDFVLVSLVGTEIIGGEGGEGGEPTGAESIDVAE
jgi:hypothetical protein